MPAAANLPAVLVAAGLLAVIATYALTGMAALGSGAWELLAGGSERDRQRALIEQTAAPVREASHGALLVVLGLAGAAFPPAFDRVLGVLAVPIAAVFVGIALRLVAVRLHGGARRALVAGSLAVPALLGTIVGTLSAGYTRPFPGRFVFGEVPAWLDAWPVSVGLFALALSAYLAAVRLCVAAREADEEETLVPESRSRALASWLAVALIALFLFFQSWAESPEVAAGLTSRPWSWPLVGATLLASIAVLHGLIAGLFRLAYFAAAVQVALVVVGWGAAQYPWLVVGELTVAEAAAHPSRLWASLGALAFVAAGVGLSVARLRRGSRGKPPAAAQGS